MLHKEVDLYFIFLQRTVLTKDQHLTAFFPCLHNIPYAGQNCSKHDPVRMTSQIFFLQKWYFVTKIVQTNCEKIVLVIEKKF